jgi:hypothetical protein
MNTPFPQPNSYSRYQSGAGKAAGARPAATGNVSSTGQYHRYRYGRHVRTPRDPEAGQP